MDDMRRATWMDSGMASPVNPETAMVLYKGPTTSSDASTRNKRQPFVEDYHSDDSEGSYAPTARYHRNADSYSYPQKVKNEEDMSRPSWTSSFSQAPTLGGPTPPMQGPAPMFPPSNLSPLSENLSTRGTKRVTIENRVPPARSMYRKNERIVLPQLKSRNASHRRAAQSYHDHLEGRKKIPRFTEYDSDSGGSESVESMRSRPRERTARVPRPRPSYIRSRHERSSSEPVYNHPDHVYGDLEYRPEPPPNAQSGINGPGQVNTSIEGGQIHPYAPPRRINGHSMWNLQQYPRPDPFYLYQPNIPTNAIPLPPGSTRNLHKSPPTRPVQTRVASSSQLESQKDSGPSEPNLSQSIPADTISSRSAMQIDPIELLESYIGLLKSIKEREFAESSRVLSWIENRTSARVPTPEKKSDDISSSMSDCSESYGPSTIVPVARTHTAAQPLPATNQSMIDPMRYLVEDDDSTSESDEEVDTSVAGTYSRSELASIAAPNSRLEAQYTERRRQVNSTHQPLEPSQSSSSFINDPNRQQAEGNQAEIEALRRDVFDLRMQLAKQNGKGAFASMYASWRKSRRRPPTQGLQRLEWICDCGEEMYADLPITSLSEHEQMLCFLTGRGPSTRAAGFGHTPPSDLESGTAFPDSSVTNSGTNSPGKGKSPLSSLGSSSTFVGSSSSQSFINQPNNLVTSNKYLELCINVGKYETKLAEIQVKSGGTSTSLIYTDAHLFQKINERYFSFRKFSWRRLLYRPNGIRFVHFGVQSGQRVNFFAGNPLPTEEQMASKCYEYNLRPPIPPPMDSRTFLHYFWKHGSHSHSTNARYLDRLPKKVGESLIKSLGVDDMSEGWGIHILEGPNKPAICWMMLAILCTSFGVSVGYDLITKSGDSGFAIGQWMVAALTVVLSALYFALEDDVDSSFDSTYTLLREPEWTRSP